VYSRPARRQRTGGSAWRVDRQCGQAPAVLLAAAQVQDDEPEAVGDAGQAGGKQDVLDEKH
jgi:hypothetical protein